MLIGAREKLNHIFIQKLIKNNPVIQKAPVSKKDPYSLSGSDTGA